MCRVCRYCACSRFSYRLAFYAYSEAQLPFPSLLQQIPLAEKEKNSQRTQRTKTYSVCLLYFRGFSRRMPLPTQYTFTLLPKNSIVFACIFELHKRELFVGFKSNSDLGKVLFVASCYALYAYYKGWRAANHKRFVEIGEFKQA